MPSPAARVMPQRYRLGLVVERPFLIDAVACSETLGSDVGDLHTCRELRLRWLA